MTKIEIEHIQITPNPINAKKSIKIEIDVTDREVTYVKQSNYAGEIYSGQKMGVI